MKKLLLISFILCGLLAKGQDIQYSQFYANALYLNPAFAGANQTTRAILHSRLQWPALDATYVASTVSIDHYFPQYKSGVGLLVNTDQMSAYNGRTFRNLELGLQYAYQLELSNDWTFRPALQLGFAQKSFNSSSLQWVQQYNNTQGYIGGSSGEENNISNAPIYYADVSAGGLLYNKNFWVGIASDHLNRPSQSFVGDGTNKLYVKTTLHAGYKFILGAHDRPRYGIEEPESEISLSPVMLYKMQGKSDQLDLGMYFRYDALVLGSWYRGIPTKVYPTEKSNNEAIVAMIGTVFGGFNIGYSYDFTISKLAPAVSGGAHELSITYNFVVESNSKKRKPAPRNRKPVCPKF